MDFARALGHHITTPLSGDLGTDPESTRITPIADAAPSGAEPPAAHRSWLRPRVLLPALLGVLLVVAVAFVAGRFRGEDAMSAQIRDSTTAAAPSSSLAPPPPVTTTTTTTTTAAPTEPAPTDTNTVTVDQAPAAVVGARCGEPGATGTTADGATVYCSQLQYTNRFLWSVQQNVIANPVLTAPPSVAPPSEDESPVRICMAETGHSRLRCAEEILRGDGG